MNAIEQAIERVKMIKDFVDPIRGKAVHCRVDEIVETLQSMQGEAVNAYAMITAPRDGSEIAVIGPDDNAAYFVRWNAEHSSWQTADSWFDEHEPIAWYRLAHPQSPAVVEGYVLVPVEPTDEMMDAGTGVVQSERGGFISDHAAIVGEIYKAMLTASGKGE